MPNRNELLAEIADHIGVLERRKRGTPEWWTRTVAGQSSIDNPTWNSESPDSQISVLKPPKRTTRSRTIPQHLSDASALPIVNIGGVSLGPWHSAENCEDALDVSKQPNPNLLQQYLNDVDRR
jgi:hypothetical protein